MEKSFYLTNLEDLEACFKYHGLSYNRSGIVRWKEKYAADFIGAAFFIYDHHIKKYQRIIIFPRSDNITPLELNEILEMLKNAYPEHECSVVYGYPEL